jgi:hypothetical protein
MANKKQLEFNKLMAFDELILSMQTPPNPKASESIQSMLNGQNYLQKIHDEAFEKGFEKGCEATKTIDEL